MVTPITTQVIAKFLKLLKIQPKILHREVKKNQINQKNTAIQKAATHQNKI